jgi:UDP-N-acetylmuramoyl-L-alanyl-D-glutamate--2,6-diaminopimelate ligase
VRTLPELLQNVAVVRTAGEAARPVGGLAYDSRAVEPGDLFVCLKGFATDGHRFVGEALARGATAVVCQVNNAVLLPSLGSAALVEVADSRVALAELSCEFFRHPSRELKLFGVTGTNGKTTTAAMVARVFESAGIPSASLGTLGIRVGEQTSALSRTTPEAPDLQGALRGLVDDGIRAVCMEVSSHALSLHRVRGCAFDAAVFTNLTRDHLDFHPTLEDYFAAKAALFTDYAGAAGQHKAFAAVINADDAAGRRLVDLCPSPTLTYGIDAEANLRAEGLIIRRDGAAYVARFDEVQVPVHLLMTGRFNVYNSLAAAGVGVVSGLDPVVIRNGLESVHPPAGRLEMIEEGQPFAVAVDYAHTPDGLRNAISTVREIAEGRVITLFGCGGDRDRAKRPQMGALAASMSDLCIVTSDNPRTEDPEAIVGDILEGIEDTGGCEVIVDRQTAIARALALAEPGDFVLIAGKGHETYQIFRDRTIHFDDREVARNALRGQLSA